MNETLKTLMERRSVRSYKEEQVPEDILQQILEAGEYAPSGMGMQSAVMVVVRDKDTINQISRMNAAVMGNDGDPFYGAPTVVIVFGDSTRGTYVEGRKPGDGEPDERRCFPWRGLLLDPPCERGFPFRRRKNPHEKMGLGKGIRRYRKLYPGLFQ